MSCAGQHHHHRAGAWAETQNRRPLFLPAGDPHHSWGRFEKPFGYLPGLQRRNDHPPGSAALPGRLHRCRRCRLFLCALSAKLLAETHHQRICVLSLWLCWCWWWRWCAWRAVDSIKTDVGEGLGNKWLTLSPDRTLPYQPAILTSYAKTLPACARPGEPKPGGKPLGDLFP